MLYPGLAITLIILATNLLGDGPRDIFDARLLPGGSVSSSVAIGQAIEVILLLVKCS